jgi:hypothetical protein
MAGVIPQLPLDDLIGIVEERRFPCVGEIGKTTTGMKERRLCGK